jgi:hypothetical protein
MKTLRIDKETNPLGTVKYYLMYQADEGELFKPIGYSTSEADMLGEFAKAKENIDLGIAGTTVIKQETF